MTVSTITQGPFTGAFAGDISAIEQFAQSEANIANGFTTQLALLSGSLATPLVAPVFATGPTTPAQITAGQPTFQNIAWTSPAAPSAFVGTLDTSTLFPAPFDKTPPTLSFSPIPTGFSDIAPVAPTLNLTFADPTLSVNLPAAPALLSLNVAPFAGINLPTIDPNAVPTLTAVAPSIREYVPGAQYTSNLLTSLRTSLQSRIDNGGTGLAPTVEQAIWDRGREREARSRADALKGLDQMESLGFALPPGGYLDARLKILTESQYVELGLSREVMIKQAELEQSNVLAALQTATAIESKLIDYTNETEQRLFESTKYATEAGIAIYNAAVQGYVAYVDAYKTKIQIYTAQVQAEIAKVDAYKAQIEAERAKAEINTALVQQYKVSADIALSNIEIYKAQIAAIQTKAEIEKIKIEVYGEQIRAYVGKINAYTAGVEGYRASLEAEKTKQQVFQSQVEAFSAQVGAAAKQADVRIAQYQGQIAAKNLEIEGFRATIAGETARVQATAAANATIADTFKSNVAAIQSFNEVQTKQWQVAVDQAQRTTEIGVSTAKANADLYISTRGLAIDAVKAGAQVSAQLGAAALNAVHWSNSYSASNAFGVSLSSSSSDSVSYSRSESESKGYNYNENHSFSN